MKISFKSLALVSCGLVVGLSANYFYNKNYLNVNQVKITKEDTRTIAGKTLHVNEGPKISILSTNYNNRWEPQDELKNIPVDIPIFDIGFVVYSKKFAERFGYPEKYIANLDPGMQALEFRMKSDGGNVNCYLNTLLDNNLGLDFPKEDYVRRFEARGTMMRFPQKIDSFKDPEGLYGYREQPEDKEFRMNVTQEKGSYYTRNTRIGNFDYKRDPTGKWPGLPGSWSTNYVFEGYSNKYLKGLDYVSVFTTCSAMPRKHFLRDNAALWFKKIGGDDYRYVGWAKPEQFLKFRIPPEFGKKAAELMKPAEKHMFLELLNFKK